MTSSFVLKKIGETPERYTYSLPNSPLGGLEDSYLKINGPCHPDFITTPIGRPYGAKMCVRRSDQCGRRIGDTMMLKSEETIRNSQGFHRASVDLYDPKADIPNQKWNPQYYSSRRAPYEQDNIRADLWRMPVKYSGTGIDPLRTPAELRDKGKPYMEYAYSFTPDEDQATGMRTASNWKQAKPEPKYDVTRLHQPYPIWKREMEYMGHPQDDKDTTFFERIV